MPQGDKSSYTDKQKRQAQHIEQGYEDRGVPKEEAEARAWATVNKPSTRSRAAATNPVRAGENWTPMVRHARAVALAARLRPGDRRRIARPPRRRAEKPGAAMLVDTRKGRPDHSERPFLSIR